MMDPTALQGIALRLDDIARRLSRIEKHLGVVVAEDAGVGHISPPRPSIEPIDDYVESLVDRLMRRHPRPGFIARAVHAAAHAALREGAANAEAIAEWARLVADAHTAWVRYWSEHPNEFVPPLHTWFENQDYRCPPGGNS